VLTQQVPPVDREVLTLVDEDGVEAAFEAGFVSIAHSDNDIDETLAAAARRRLDGMGCHIHVAEDPLDARMSKLVYDAAPIQRLDRHGLLDDRTLAIHCIHLGADDRALLAERGAVVVHNPESNANNGVGRLDVLAAAADRGRLAEAVFAETTTFGLRVVPCDREYAEERRETVKIGKLTVHVRLGFAGGKLATVSPEYEDVRRVAAAVGRPARVVYEAAQSAARTRFSGS